MRPGEEIEDHFGIRLPASVWAEQRARCAEFKASLVATGFDVRSTFDKTYARTKDDGTRETVQDVCVRCASELYPPGTTTITDGHTIAITCEAVLQDGGNPSTPPNICMRCHQHGFLCDCDDVTPVVVPVVAPPEPIFNPIAYTGELQEWATKTMKEIELTGTITCYFCCAKYKMVDWMLSNGRSVHGMDVCGKCLHLISVADADQ